MHGARKDVSGRRGWSNRLTQLARHLFQAVHFSPAVEALHQMGFDLDFLHMVQSVQGITTQQVIRVGAVTKFVRCRSPLM